MGKMALFTLVFASWESCWEGYAGGTVEHLAERAVFYLITQVRCQGKEGELEMEAYCVKCKAKREMKDAKEVTMKNGKPATQGVCPTCGTKMCKIGKAK